MLCSLLIPTLKEVEFARLSEIIFRNPWKRLSELEGLTENNTYCQNQISCQSNNSNNMSTTTVISKPKKKMIFTRVYII